jgi:hypothetical protein
METINPAATGKSACCGAFLKNGKLSHYESDSHPQGSGLFLLLHRPRRFHPSHGCRQDNSKRKENPPELCNMRWDERSDLTGHSRYCESTPRESSGVQCRSRKDRHGTKRLRPHRWSAKRTAQGVRGEERGKALQPKPGRL